MAPMSRAGPRLPRQHRHGGGGGGHQARPLPHRAPVRGRFLGALPRPHDGRRQPDGAPRPSTTRTSARCCRAFTTPRTASKACAGSRGAVQAPGAGGARSRRSSWSRSRARAATSSPRPGFLPRLRDLCDTPRHPARSPTRSSRAPDAPGRCGRSSTRAWSPTSCSRPRASRSGMPLGAMIAKAELMSWEAGRPRQHVRREPGRLRRRCWRRSTCWRTG